MEVTRELDTDRIKRFHTHLDKCFQCKHHPFGLCLTGAELLKYAATGEIDNPELLKQEVKNGR